MCSASAITTTARIHHGVPCGSCVIDCGIACMDIGLMRFSRLSAPQSHRFAAAALPDGERKQRDRNNQPDPQSGRREELHGIGDWQVEVRLLMKAAAAEG